MTNRKRLAALLLCVGLVLVLSASAFLLIHEADHDCSGEDCPVCRLIAINIRLLRTLGLAVLALLSLFFLRAGQSVSRCPERSVRSFSGTLVTWKIRLDN